MGDLEIRSSSALGMARIPQNQEVTGSRAGYLQIRSRGRNREKVIGSSNSLIEMLLRPAKAKNDQTT